jgi:sulfur carrier protein ThiS
VRVELHLFATLASFLPPNSSGGAAILDVPEGFTLDDLRRAVGIPDDLDYVALVNGEEATAERPLRARDVVTLFPPLAGGLAACLHERPASPRVAQSGWYTSKRSGSVSEPGSV